ncbi:MAG: STAS domain-containing protein [Acidimicrobiia bacterium]|nr:STAS domain-containing protein [Acidimicrobiia bacterium]
MAHPAEPRFTLSLAEEDGGRIVRISLVGEVDHSNHDVLADALSDASDADAAEIVVDCRDLDFIDSAGLGALVDARSVAGADRLEVRDASPQVERLLNVVGF